MSKPRRPKMPADEVPNPAPANAGGPRAGARDAGGRFTRGTSGNPAGKPKGRRHRATEAVLALLEGEAEALTRRAVELALKGDGKDAVLALRLCLERLAPPPRDRRVVLDLPTVDSAGGCVHAMAAIVAAVGAGELTPSEAQALSALVEATRRAVETEDIAERLAALEERIGS